jgi:hypothetical protein
VGYFLEQKIIVLFPDNASIHGDKIIAHLYLCALCASAVIFFTAETQRVVYLQLIMSLSIIMAH